MSEFFDYLIAEALIKKEFSGVVRKNNSKVFNKTYNKVIDQTAIRMFDKTIENESLCIIFKALSRTERLIILFNILMNYEIDDTAEIIGTHRDSIYSLKYRALKKFKAALEGLDK